MGEGRCLSFPLDIYDTPSTVQRQGSSSVPTRFTSGLAPLFGARSGRIYLASPYTGPRQLAEASLSKPRAGNTEHRKLHAGWTGAVGLLSDPGRRPAAYAS